MEGGEGKIEFIKSGIKAFIFLAVTETAFDPATRFV